MKKSHLLSIITTGLFSLGLLASSVHAQIIDPAAREARREADVKKLQSEFQWWPTDAKPSPVKDEQKGGYWWWPTEPGTVKDLWGNRGFVYVYKVIFDYKADEENTEAATTETVAKPSLIIKKIIRNVKIYFDYNKADLREDHTPILEKAVATLGRNKEASILITGNCDARGSDEYNLKLGNKRGASVKQYMLDNGIPEERIKIVSRGKLDAVAPVKDIVGMQKDRNAQFMIAEVEEVNIPATQKATDVMPDAKQVEDNKFTVEETQQVESGVKASTREYTIQANDSLWKIAEKEMGKGSRWQYLYELNKDRIKNPNKLKKGTVIIIPIE